jgi:hypothetical protein
LSDSDPGGASWAPAAARASAVNLIECAPMTESPLVKRLLWSGLLAGTGAVASLVSTRVATLIWTRVFGEEPPE